MSTDFSELIAMGCPDLATNNDGGKVVEIMDGGRRLSVKQMTATELAAMRALTETETALVKGIENVEVTINNAQLTESRNIDATLNTSSNGITTCHKTPKAAPTKCSPVKSLPTMSLARSRITSLPNIMHINEVVEYEYDDENENENANINILGLAEKPQLELQSNEGHMTTVSEAEETAGDAIKRSISKSSKGDETGSDAQLPSTDAVDFETATNSMADSIEVLRQQRLHGGRCNDRARRSNSPSSRSVIRMPAPDRLHSLSTSSVSLDISKNLSRRESNVSYMEETELSTSASIVVSSAPIFPLSKTTSEPNFEQRRSSLSNLFPGPPPLVTGTTALHTEQKIVADSGLTLNEIEAIVQDTLNREISTNKAVHRTKTPPPVGVKLGVNLKKVSPQRSHITVKKNDAPMLGVVLRKVEKKVIQQKSILDDDKPLYQISIVRSDHKEYKPVPKPPAPLQKSATTTAVQKVNPGELSKHAQQLAAQQKEAYTQQRQQQMRKQRPQLGVPITIQKIEDGKIIIIKKIIIPKNSKIPEQYLKVGMICSVIVLRIFVLPLSR